MTTTTAMQATSREEYEALGRRVKEMQAQKREEAARQHKAEVAAHAAVKQAAGLSGTDKQIAWATDIRGGYQARRDGMMAMCEDPRMRPQDAARARDMMTAWDGYTSARQWIDAKDDVARLCGAYDRTPKS